MWFGSPHVPHEALPADKAAYAALPEKDQNYYGEIAAVDRNVGRLRAALRELNRPESKILTVEDPTGKIEVMLFPRVYTQFKDLVEKADSILVMAGTLDMRMGQPQLKL